MLKLAAAAEKQVNSYKRKFQDLGGQLKGAAISILGCGFTLPVGSNPRTFIGLIEEKDVTNARRVLTDICEAGVRIRIVVDDPEYVFSVGRDLDVHMLGGFCLAALALSNAIPTLKVIGLFKSHVYYPVVERIPDLSNYTDHMTPLCWNEDELVLLIDSRLKSSSTNWT